MNKSIGLFALGFLILLGMIFAPGITISGVISYVGLHFLVATVKPLKFLVYHFGGLIDVMLMAFTLFMAVTGGFMISMSMIIMSLGYTTMLRPWVRDTYKL